MHVVSSLTGSARAVHVADAQPPRRRRSTSRAAKRTRSEVPPYLVHVLRRGCGCRPAPGRPPPPQCVQCRVMKVGHRMYCIASQKPAHSFGVRRESAGAVTRAHNGRRIASTSTSSRPHWLSGHPLARAQSSTAVWPFLAAMSATLRSHGQRFARAHCNTARCPPRAAAVHVSASHGQRFARAPCNTARCPPWAAAWHVAASHGQRFARAHCNTARCPPRAASSQVRASQREPFARAHCSTARCPFRAATRQVGPFFLHGQPFARAHCSTARCPP
jgi:hypothetical protein